MRRRPITAGELLRHLGGDFEFRRRQRERDAARAKLRMEVAARERPIRARLARVGLPAASIHDVGLRVPLSAKAISVLNEALVDTMREVGWQDSSATAMVQESILRALCRSKWPYPGDALVRVFEHSDNQSLKWLVGNVIAESPVEVPLDWILEHVQDDTQGKAGEMLVLAVARRFPRREAMPILRELFARFPGHVAMAIGEQGEREDLDFLLEHRDSAHPAWIRREIEKVIRKIRKRRQP